MKDSPTLRTPPEGQTKEAVEARRYAALADASNTQRAYASDWKQFLTWCRERDINPLPIEPESLATYLRYCVEKKKLKVSTVKRRLVAICEAHKRVGHDGPNTAWVVKNTMKRLWREHGSPSLSKAPILVEDIKEMMKFFDTDSLSGIRDKAIILLGYASSLRRSDIVNIDVEDLSKAEEGLVIMVRQGKTDQHRKGRKIAIPYGKHEETCPVTAIFDWLLASKISSGPLFRGLTKAGKPRQTRLSAQVVRLLVIEYCCYIGKKPEKFGAHSLRHGFATSTAMAGASERKIQDQTGHLGRDMLRRYIREAQLFRDHAFSYLDL